jgi:hypothetical protein
MKRWLGVVIAVLTGFFANAETVLFKTSTEYVTTGEVIEGGYNVDFTTNVQEIAGLQITVRSGETNQQINANSESFGINNVETIADEAARFEFDESLILSFNKTIEITQINFRFFEEGETFHISVDGEPDFLISYADLTSIGSDIIDTNLVVAANTEIRLFTNEQIGLESMDITVLGGAGEPALSLISSNGTTYVRAGFDGMATTNYVIQSCTNLVSNGWITVSAPFSADTNMAVDTIHESVFYRLNIE